jgi:hypothetical protein
MRKGMQRRWLIRKFVNHTNSPPSYPLPDSRPGRGLAHGGARQIRLKFIFACFSSMKCPAFRLW